MFSTFLYEDRGFDTTVCWVDRVERSTERRQLFTTVAAWIGSCRRREHAAVLIVSACVRLVFPEYDASAPFSVANFYRLSSFRRTARLFARAVRAAALFCLIGIFVLEFESLLFRSRNLKGNVVCWLYPCNLYLADPRMLPLIC